MSILCQEMATNFSPTTTDHSTITSNFKLKASKNMIPLTSIFGYPAYTKFFLTIRILCGWRNIKDHNQVHLLSSVINPHFKQFNSLHAMILN